MSRPATVAASVLALAVVLAPLGACQREDATGSAPALTREEFVEVMVALREAEQAVVEEDSAAELFQRRKAEILERHGTTEEDLLAWAEAASRDLPAMAETWEEISTRLRRPIAPDTSLPDSAADAERPPPPPLELSIPR